MVNILGVGAAYPGNNVTDAFLDECNIQLNAEQRALLPHLGITSRKVILPLNYIASTKNVDLFEARKLVTDTPTTLGVAAAKQALERAGITTDQIGLVIGDCATPFQSCPSEGQRIAGALGIKTASYDLIGGAGAMPIFIETILNWKPERLPDYILCVSSNTPSVHIRYSGEQIAPYVFGDGACAFIISTKHSGKLKILDSYLKRHSSYKPVTMIERDLSFCSQHLINQEELFHLIDQGVSRLSRVHGIERENSYLVGPQLHCGDLLQISNKLGFKPERMLLNATTCGYSIGSAGGSALAEAWDQLITGEQVVLIHAGDGMWSGVLLLKAQ